MKYELVKQLEAAGYPVSTPNVPTLEELIEACGRDFFQMTQGSSSWFAECDDPDKTGIHEGSTPSEAVAHLWLALNTKLTDTT